jgi:hypothetical protein
MKARGESPHHSIEFKRLKRLRAKGASERPAKGAGWTVPAL